MILHLVVAQLQNDVDIVLVFEKGMKPHNVCVVKSPVDFDLRSKLNVQKKLSERVNVCVCVCENTSRMLFCISLFLPKFKTRPTMTLQCKAVNNTRILYLFLGSVLKERCLGHNLSGKQLSCVCVCELIAFCKATL